MLPWKLFSGLKIVPFELSLQLYLLERRISLCSIETLLWLSVNYKR